MNNGNGFVLSAGVMFGISEWVIVFRGRAAIFSRKALQHFELFHSLMVDTPLKPMPQGETASSFKDQMQTIGFQSFHPAASCSVPTSIAFVPLTVALFQCGTFRFFSSPTVALFLCHLTHI